MILISEDVWGAPFQALEGSFPILRNDDLWNNPEELKSSLKDATALVVRNRTKVTADVIAAAPKLKVIVEYEKLGMKGALEHKLNAHNEFYQVFISLGLIGFIFLILSLILPLFFAIKTNNGIYILFLVIVILNFLPESMLETQAGVMFYAFFNSLLCFKTTNN